MVEGAPPEDSVEALVIKATKGARAEGGRDYIGNFLWARLWQAVTRIANCPPDLNQLLMYKSEISTCMKLAQEIQLDLVNAEAAIAKVKKLFTTPPQI